MAFTCTSVAGGGNWNAPATWTSCGGGIPVLADNAIISGPGAVLVNVASSITALTIDPGVTLNVQAQLRSYGITTINGKISFIANSGSRFYAGVVVNPGGIWSDPGNSAISFRGGGIANNGGTFIAGTGVYEIRSVAQTISGAGLISIPNLLTTTTVTNTGTLAVGSALTGSMLVNGATGTLSLGGTSAITTLTATAAGNKVNYIGVNQTIKPVTYYHLALSNAGTKSLAGATTVAGNFSVGAGATFSNGANALSVAGNFDQNGTFTAGAGTVTLNGGAAMQSISGSGPLGFTSLTVNNTGGITLARNVTVTGAIIGAVTLTNTCPTDYTLTSNGGSTVAHSCPAPGVFSINRADPDPTTAVSVSWTIVFSTGVTGVSAGNFSLVNSGLGGTPAITLVGGSGTTWTVTASTGTGTGTLGLDMVNSAGIAPAITNLPFTGQVYSVRPVIPAVYYHDTTSGVNVGFDGLTNVTGINQVIPPIITASLNPVSTCPVTSARSNNHPTGLYAHSRWYLNADYAVDTNIGANPTGSARLRGGAITNTVIMNLYDYDPVMGVKTLIGSSAPITLTGGGTTTTYPYSIAGAIYTIPAGHRLMLEYTFNQPVATQNARVYCDAIASYISVTETPALTSTLHHLEIQSIGNGLTCAASTLIVKACADAAIPCVTPYTLGVGGTLSATGTPAVNWDGSTGGAAGAGFVIPSGSSSVTKNMQVVTAGSVVFGIVSSSPAPTNPTSCNFGAPSCTFLADTAGFIFSDSATGGGYAIPAQVSGIATPMLYLRALQTSIADPAACTPAIVGQTTSVNMGYTCNNPAICQPGNFATINATPVASGGTAINLTFDANGSAPITVRYDDAGQITLNANKTVTPFGGSTPVTISGNSNAFVVKPDHFDLSGIQQTVAPNLGNPAAADATGAKFVKAGESFTVTVTARNALGNVTPNYGQEITAESVKLSPALAAGLGLTDNPSLGGAFGAFSGGVATGTGFAWNEVGIITLTPMVADANYLGAGDVIGITSGNIGRFYAAKFALSGGVIANRTGLAGCNAPAGCGTFTYMGEQMSAVFNLAARAVDGTTTLLNYNWSATPANQFAKLNPMAVVVAGTGGPLDMGAVDNASTRTPFPPCGAMPAHPCLAPVQATTGTFVSGNASVTVPFAIHRDNAAAAGPYALLDIAVAPQDSDGVIMAAYDRDTVNVVAGVNNHALAGQTMARFGRLRLVSGQGSELNDYFLPVEAQYWSGTAWVTNSNDSNTIFAAGNVNVKSWVPGIPAGSAPIPGSVAAITGGFGGIRLGKPGGRGVATICLDLGVTTECSAGVPGTMEFLGGNWLGGAFSVDPSATVYFGRPRPDSFAPWGFIYQRENF